MPEEENKLKEISTKEYYDYYYSQKPIDPRLEKPTWNIAQGFSEKF